MAEPNFRDDPFVFIYGEERDRAVDSLRRYMRSFSRRNFERTADLERPDRFTARDLLSVQMLAVQVPAEVAWWILNEGAEELSTLLAQVSRSEDALWDSTVGLEGDAPAVAAFRLLRSKSGMGRVRTSKLLAAKRPHLLPVYDEKIGLALGIGPRDNDWMHWRSAFADPAVRQAVASVRNAVDEARHLSLLRTMDVVIWMRVWGWASVGEGDRFPPLRAA